MSDDGPGLVNPWPYVDSRGGIGSGRRRKGTGRVRPTMVQTPDSPGETQHSRPSYTVTLTHPSRSLHLSG